jgi:alpha-beta hydrolase superfamily lysophospholipase
VFGVCVLGHSVGGVLCEHCWEHKAWKMLFATKDFTAFSLSGHWCILRRTVATSPF